MLLFTLMGVLGGYTSARLCKAPDQEPRESEGAMQGMRVQDVKVFDGDEGRWKMTTFMQAFLFPGGAMATTSFSQIIDDCFQACFSASSSS